MQPKILDTITAADALTILRHLAEQDEKMAERIADVAMECLCNVDLDVEGIPGTCSRNSNPWTSRTFGTDPEPKGTDMSIPVWRRGKCSKKHSSRFGKKWKGWLRFGEQRLLQDGLFRECSGSAHRGENLRRCLEFWSDFCYNE